MVNKSYKLKKHYENLKTEIIDKKEIKVYNNIGKYFYYQFIAPKLKYQNIEIYRNSVVYLYDKIDKDFNKEDEILELINNEKENYNNMVDSIQYLRGGCITIQLTQGLSVRNIFDTYQNKNINKNKLLYLVEFNEENDEGKNINYYKEKISASKDLIYENLITLEDKLIIVFKDSFQFALFSKRQKLNLKLIPKKENLTLNNEPIEEGAYNNMKIYIVKFDKSFSTDEIHSKMKLYMRKINRKYNCKLNYYIDEKNDSNSITVYYYITPKRYFRTRMQR
jgi:hypothetical protein